MKWLIGSLVAFDVAVALFLIAITVRAIAADLRHRGEDPDPVDGHAEDAMALLDVQVPQGTGEALAREIETWLRKENA